MKTINFDWAIKNILRDKKNFDVLEGFLSTLLEKDIKVLELLESESNNEENLKFNRVDLMVSSGEEQFIIEIQNSRETDYLERILFGTSKVIVESLALGENYKDIKKVISINILYFNLGKGDDYIYLGKTDFYGLNGGDKLSLKKRFFIDKKKFILQEKNIFPEYYLIRVKHFEQIIGSPIDEWIYMFKNNEIKDSFTSKGMNAVRKKLNYLNMNEKQRKAHDRYVMNLVREKDIVETAEQDGYIKAQKEYEILVTKAQKEKEKAQKKEKKAQEEKKKAQEEKNEALKKETKAQKEKEETKKQMSNLIRLLLSNNIPIEQISEQTGVSIEDIKRI